jgi:hypothetical protein
MGDFSADWLALREPADVAARSADLTDRTAEALGPGRVLDVLDLAAGTGSNLRYLTGHLPADQRWLLVDRDRALLDQVPRRMSPWAATRGYEVIREAESLILRRDGLRCRIATRQLDLTVVDDDLFAGRTLVTASALLDLVSDRWLRSLAARCRTSGAAVLFALNYDGRIQCTPAEPEDEAICDLVNRHQRTDKGFGEAAGPGAIDRAQEHFAGAGYLVRREPSDWVLQPSSRELQRQLIEGWAQASAGIAPAKSPWIRSWEARRLAHAEANHSWIVVGHADFGAWLPNA